MKIQSISVYNTQRSCVKKIKTSLNQPEKMQQKQVNFKGDNGAVAGIIGGAVVGALGAAAIIATGGLAGVVAAAGYGSTIALGSASLTHAGGIIGSIIEDKLDEKNNEK